MRFLSTEGRFEHAGRFWRQRLRAGSSRGIPENDGMRFPAGGLVAPLKEDKVPLDFIEGDFIMGGWAYRAKRRQYLGRYSR